MGRDQLIHAGLNFRSVFFRAGYDRAREGIGEGRNYIQNSGPHAKARFRHTRAGIQFSRPQEFQNFVSASMFSKKKIRDTHQF